MAEETTNNAIQAVCEITNQFSLDFFKEVARSNPGNVIISPLSAWISLSTAACGSRGETEKEFKRVLSLPKESLGKIGLVDLIDSINVTKNIELRLVNKLFINEKFSIKPSFHELTREVFRSTSQNVNFVDEQAAVDTINEWVEQQTNNRIKDVLTPDMISKGTAMVLVNTLYFKGNWAKQFEHKLTKDLPFHVTKKRVRLVSTMHRIGNYIYGVLPELEATFVELPYNENEVSMIIILPNKLDGLDEVEQKLAQQDVTKLIDRGNEREISLFLPKFKILASYDLSSHLKEMGLRTAFDMDTADFSGISDCSVCISSVVQKVYIDTKEEGTEATMLTATKGRMPSCGQLYVPPPTVFNVDRPFHMSIIKKNGSFDSRAELFTGRVVDPSRWWEGSLMSSY